MVQSKATTVAAYLAELPVPHRKIVEEVRAVIRDNLPEGYVETMRWGMISYEVPLERYPGTYNGQPLAYAGLAAQKSHYALYLMGLYTDPARMQWLKEQFHRIGKKPDIGKSCIRFRRVEDIPLAAIGKLIKGTSVAQYIKQYEASRK